MPSKGLIVFYSRGGTTEIVANAIKEKSGFDMDRLSYASGKKISFAAAIAESLGKKTALISGVTCDPGEYDEIVFVSPVWASSLASPIRTYMVANSEKIKSYSIVCTMSNSGSDGLFSEAESILKKPAASRLAIRAADAKKKAFDIGKIAL